MKKIVFALMCIIFTTGIAKAQKQFTFGPKIGVDYTHRWGNNVNDNSALNFQAGAFFEYRFNNRISIAPELVFATHSTPKREIVDWIDKDSPIDITRTGQINYINIPILLKCYFTPSLSVDLGPQLGICVYDKFTEKWKDDGKDKKTKHDLGANRFDFGVGIGLTYNITKDVFIQGRYTLGLTKIFDNCQDKNGNAQIAIGYRF